jgi:signal peptidase
MNNKKAVARVIEVLFLLAIVLLVVGQVLGQPLLLGFVETGSMQPTMAPEDGFIAVPPALAGPPEEGDVITFRAEEINGGGLVTHRVVRTTQSGYVTKGDNNNAPDQQVGEPPVKRPQVVAHAAQVNGEVLVIPQLGMVVTGGQAALETVNLVLERLFGIGARITLNRLPYVVFAFSILAYGVSTWREKNEHSPSRERRRDTGTDARFLVAVMMGFLVITATGAMVFPSGDHQYSLVATTSPPDGDSSDIVALGEETTRSYEIGNGGLIPTMVYLEPGSNGVAIDRQEFYLKNGERTMTEVTLKAPPETGYYRYYVSERRYLAVLPQSTIRTLYEVHPWLPIAAIDAVIAVPFYLFGVTLVGTGRIRRRERDGPSKLSRLVNRYT